MYDSATNYKGLSNVSRGVTNREQTHVLDEIPPPVHRTIVGKSLGFGRRGAETIVFGGDDYYFPIGVRRFHCESRGRERE